MIESYQDMTNLCLISWSNELSCIPDPNIDSELEVRFSPDIQSVNSDLGKILSLSTNKDNPS